MSSWITRPDGIVVQSEDNNKASTSTADGEEPESMLSVFLRTVNQYMGDDNDDEYNYAPVQDRVNAIEAERCANEMEDAISWLKSPEAAALAAAETDAIIRNCNEPSSSSAGIIADDGSVFSNATEFKTIDNTNGHGLTLMTTIKLKRALSIPSWQFFGDSDRTDNNSCYNNNDHDHDHDHDDDETGSIEKGIRGYSMRDSSSQSLVGGVNTGLPSTQSRTIRKTAAISMAVILTIMVAMSIVAIGGVAVLFFARDGDDETDIPIIIPTCPEIPFETIARVKLSFDRYSNSSAFDLMEGKGDWGQLGGKIIDAYNDISRDCFETHQRRMINCSYEFSEYNTDSDTIDTYWAPFVTCNSSCPIEDPLFGIDTLDPVTRMLQNFDPIVHPKRQLEPQTLLRSTETEPTGSSGWAFSSSTERRKVPISRTEFLRRLQARDIPGTAPPTTGSPKAPENPTTSPIESSEPTFLPHLSSHNLSSHNLSSHNLSSHHLFSNHRVF